MQSAGQKQLVDFTKLQLATFWTLKMSGKGCNFEKQRWKLTENLLRTIPSLLKYAIGACASA